MTSQMREIRTSGSVGARGEQSPRATRPCSRSGGLFDYLSDRAAEVLTRAVWERLLARGGRFFFTNLGRQNAYRVWMESMADWRLIERSETDLRRLVASACGPAAICCTEPEATGLTWLVSEDRPA